MKLEQNEETSLFSTTKIPDIFFSEYLSQSSGDYIKVYLYILFLSKYNKDIKLNDLSKKLALPFQTIQDSLKYWEDLGVITKKGTGFIINNLQEIELHKLYNPKISLSVEDIERNEKSKYRASSIETINRSFFQGLMSPAWYADINIWFDKYGFDEQVMIALFNYCLKRSALHKNYVQVVADAWSKHNVKTFNDLELYFEKQDTLQKIEKSIQKKLGITRPLTEYEKAYIEKWSVDYGYSFDVIEIALKRTTSKTSFSFDYFDKIISDWHDRNLKTADDVQNFLVQYKNQMKNKKELEKKVKYNNFEQRSYDNFDSLYANSQG